MTYIHTITTHVQDVYLHFVSWDGNVEIPGWEFVGFKIPNKGDNYLSTAAQMPASMWMATAIEPMSAPRLVYRKLADIPGHVKLSATLQDTTTLEEVYPWAVNPNTGMCEFTLPPEFQVEKVYFRIPKEEEWYISIYDPKYLPGKIAMVFKELELFRTPGPRLIVKKVK